MESDRWRSLRDLFEAACDLPPSQWRPTLERLSEDPALVDEAMAMLEAQTAGFERALQPLRDWIDGLQQPELSTGDEVGPWRLVERIASGGMGTVFVAERADGLFRQRVAIKLLRGRSATPVLEQRLAAERQILAELQHPNIARLHDGGTTPSGAPYLVMEYIDGQPLDAWCEARSPGLRERLALFLRICDAVQAAHRRLVVHCDLKPGNVLVRADGEPVLLDFGIARLLGEDADEGGGFCTPAYASPELLRGGAPVGTSSDVFSLGAMLGELLSRRRMQRPSRDPDAPVPLPSAWAGDDCPWKRLLRGDLDAIVARACAIDPQRRYASVDAFSRDIEDWLSHRPVSARHGAWWYRPMRWLRRHWRGTALAAGICCVLLAFAWRLAGERERAREEASIAHQVSDFLVKAFASASDVPAAPGHDVTARQVLDRAAARVGTDGSVPPAMLARLRRVLGQAYLELGVPLPAEELLAQAAEGYLQPGVDRPLEAANVLSSLALLVGNQRRADEAVAVARRVVDLRTRHRADAGAIADGRHTLGLALMRKADYAGSRAELEVALAILSALHGEASMQVSPVLHNLGLLYREMGLLAESEASLRRALSIREQADPRSVGVQSSLQLLAVTLGSQCRYEEAEAALARSEELAMALFGTESNRTARVRVRRVLALVDLGRYRDALVEIEGLRGMSARITGEDGLEHASLLAAEAELREARGETDRAEASYRRVLDIRASHLPGDDRSVLRAQDNLAVFLARTGRLQEAQRSLDASWPEWNRIHPAPSLELAEAALWRAELRVRLGLADDGLADLPALQRLPALDFRRRVLLAERARLHGDAATAVGAWREVVASSERYAGAESAATARWRLALAAALAAAGDAAAARIELARAEPGLRVELAAQSPLLRELDALKAGLAPAPR